MADTVYLSDDHQLAPDENPRALRTGAHTDGWVVPNTDVIISDVNSNVTDGPHNAFNYTGATGLDANIDTGEAVVSASPICRDDTTPVTLTASTADQTVYVGFDPGAFDTITLGLDGEFSASSYRIPIWEFDTDGSTVTNSTDLREIGQHTNVQNLRYETSDGSGVAVDDADALGGVGSTNYARTDQSPTFNQSINIATTASHLDLIETDESNKTWRVEALSGEFVITEVGVGEPLSINPSNGSRVEMPNGASFGSNNTYTNGAGAEFRDSDDQDGMNLAVSDPSDRFFMAPYVNGSLQFGSELTYISGQDEWRVESDFGVNGRSNLDQTFFTSTVHFQGNESVGFRLQTRTSTPPSPQVGQMWYRSDQD